ncbi:MAG: biotin/lipoyl-binding protein, partial [Calditrichae bacterium]|nr:biotin/lipoyl-binding protein [Calditrichia bacterium]
ACSSNSDRLQFASVLEGTSVQVPALTGGQIGQLWVETGHEVETGDTIAVIDTTELSLKARQLEAGMMELQSRIELAEIALKQAKADLNYMKERYDRTLILYQKNTATQQTLDDMSNQLKKAETQHKTAWQNLQILKAKND